MVISYGRQSINEGDIEAVAEVLRGDWLTTGPYVDRFEAAIAEASGSAGAAVVSTGTAALHVGYHALGIQPGDEIISTPMTFVATSACVTLDSDTSDGRVEQEIGYAEMTTGAFVLELETLTDNGTAGNSDVWGVCVIHWRRHGCE